MDHDESGRLNGRPSSANRNAADYDAKDAGVRDDGARIRELLLRVGDGDRAAFATLYEETSRRVYGLVRRVLIDPDLSRDATQDVYLQVWQLAGRFDPGAGTAMSWVMTLAHRRAVDVVRSEQRFAERQDRYAAHSQHIDHDEVVETVTDRMEAAMVVDCLGTLTATQQESVRMAYYGGLTYRDVADKLKVAVPTIKSRIRDGLIRLRNCLEVS